MIIVLLGIVVTLASISLACTLSESSLNLRKIQFIRMDWLVLAPVFLLTWKATWARLDWSCTLWWESFGQTFSSEFLPSSISTCNPTRVQRNLLRGFLKNANNPAIIVLLSLSLSLSLSLCFPLTDWFANLSHWDPAWCLPWSWNFSFT